MQNKNKNMTVALTDEGDWQSKRCIYLAKRKKHNKIYIRKTTETLSKRISKHKFKIFKKPSNNELPEHFNKEHNFVKELHFNILEKHIKHLKNYRKICESVVSSHIN